MKNEKHEKTEFPAPFLSFPPPDDFNGGRPDTAFFLREEKRRATLRIVKLFSTKDLRIVCYDRLIRCGNDPLFPSP
ncbi:MAG: hypothetical protein IKD96_08045 [Oscillospiraceae bacterium]|nr:hypothetical protein [Oscillospiraceae bacterium]